ncbi:phosphoglycerate dehydrogenase [Arthrobacter sp. NPDC056727]|uniref:phosphoglycerate dehydrogenase n=1 Tax=Arthrobacter sp. NPDC056727 TaxID=3345927 RepID=UPI00366D53A0
MTAQRVLVTTAWLSPGDEVHQMLLEAGFEVVHSSFKTRGTSVEALKEVVAGFDGIVAGTDAFTPEVIAAADKLKVFGRTGVGYDNIDVPAATAHGVAVCPTPGINRQSVAEHTVALLLNVARLIPQNIQSIRTGGWDQTSGRELGGNTLGIVGLGAIGKDVARIARVIGMDVVAYDPYFDEAFAAEHNIRRVELDELLAVSDFVSLHLFLSEETHHLINAAAIAKMKPGAYLVNAARGGVIDEEALADAIESGHLAGAALDTVEVEPLPANSRLRSLDNVLVTAHIGAATIESRRRSGTMAAQSVIDVLQGQPLPAQTVNKEIAAVPAA